MNRNLLIGLAVALTVGIGATCEPQPGSGGQGERPGDFPPPVELTQGPPVKPTPKAPGDKARANCPNTVFDSPDERCFTLQTYVESTLGPYDVYLTISGGEGAYPPHIPIAAGGWTHAVKYKTGKKLTISLHLEQEKAGSKNGYCSITDGTQYASDPIKSSHTDGGPPYIAVCQLTTNQ